MKKKPYRRENGFTLVELLIAMTLSLVVIGAIFLTFKSQQDSYVVQEQVSVMQQNARAAMYMLNRDIQMAGYYTNFDTENYDMDWDDLDLDDESIRPLIYGRNNVNTSGDGIKDNTDVIVIVKASDTWRHLAAGEGATGATVTLNDRDLDGDGEDDLNLTMKYGLLVREDLGTADLFEVNTDSGSITPPGGLDNTYVEGDLIFRADVIIYRVSEDADHPCLVRRNLGRDGAGTYQEVATDIDNLQCRYLLADGTWLDDPAGNESDIRAVEISILARTENENRGYTDTQTYTMANAPVGPLNDPYRRRLLTSIVKTRNIGL